MKACRTARSRLAGALIVLVAAPRLAPAVEEPAGGDVLSLALRSPLERSGDYDGLARAWLEALPRRAAEPQVELILRRLSAIRPLLRDEPALLPLVEKALEAPYWSGTPEQILREMLGDLYRRAGREEDRAKAREGRGFLLRWLIAGPFGKSRAAPFLEAFGPETDLRADAAYRDGWQEVSWRKLARLDPEPQVSPLDHVFPEKGVAYLLSQVKAARELDALLQRGTSDSLQVWLNGVRVVDDDAEAGPLENRRATPVRLAAGWNRVLVKARSQVWLRLCAPDGRPFPPGTLEEEAELALHPLESPPDPRREATVDLGGPGRWARWIAELEAGGAPAARRADARIGLAFLHGVYGRPELAVAEAERAVELAPGDAFVLYHAGGIYRQAPYLPRTVAKNRALGAFEKALELDPNLVPAYERVARFLEDDEKHAEAERKVREALEREPRFLPGLYLLQSIHRETKWQAEEIAAVEEIARAAPASSGPLRFWADHYEERANPSEAAARLRKAFELDRSPGVLYDLEGLELSRGRAAEATAALREARRLEPDEPSYALRLADLLARQGRPDEALPIVAELAARDPRKPEHASKAAEVLWRLGRRDEAIASWRKALELDPGNLSLKRFVASLAPGGGPEAPAQADAFWAPYDERLENWLLQVPAEGPLVEKASSIVVLDISVVRFEPDGSYAEYVHQASKLLSEESKESLARVQLGGEAVLLRTLTPAGESLEPVAAEGRRSFVMPGLSRGAYVEHAYREDHESRHGEEIRTAPFYFQDPQCRQSFLLSRYVVLLPEGLEVGTIETNLGPEGRAKGGPELAKVSVTVRDLEGGGKALIYEARAVARLEREGHMPAEEEYIPNVQLLQKSTWKEVGRELHGRYASRTHAAPELERAAREATEGATAPLEKARALYDHVNKIIPTGGGGSKAVTVLLEKAGDRTLLYKALLDVAGVPARWAFLRPLEAALPRASWDYPRASFFPYPYVAVEIEGKDPLYVSLSDRFTPFGRLPEHLEGGKAMVVDRSGERVVHLPPPDPARSATLIRGALKLGEDADVDVEIEMVTQAVTAYGQKDQLKTIPAFQRDLVLRGLATRLFPGAKVRKADMPGLEDPEKPVTFTLALTAPKALRSSGDERLLKAVFQPLGMVRGFAGRSKREHPFQLRGQRVQRDSVRVEAGPSYRLKKPPADVVLASALGTYSLRFEAQAGTAQAGSEGAVKLERELTLLPGRLEAAEFPAFLEFCEKVDAAERESLVFEKRSTEKPEGSPKAE